MTNQDPVAFPLNHLESMKAEWNRKHAEAAAEAERYKDLLDSASDIEEIAVLWQQLSEGPVSHHLFDASREHVHEQPATLDADKVLMLMGQEPDRLWKAKDVQTVFAHVALTEVRAFLNTMVGEGRLEVVRRSNRRLNFKIPYPTSA
ncbi:hypothetical protein ACFY7H_00110 [Streptomyces sp. NPDC012794]|uniref:hypothetical protein n=1 Tax=Streptomyces sp. NPDC012794 TaxID=3364850 RepID=UPI0036CF3E0E